MIEVINLCKQVSPSFSLRKLNFTARTGEITGFLGTNGSGKTTTLDIICGCRGADSGEIRINSETLEENPFKIKAQLGYLPETPPLHDEMTVSDCVTFSARIHGLSRNAQKSQVEAMFDQFELHAVRSKLISQLSKGYKQRVAFAQALVHGPKALILDEPTDGLDPVQLVATRELIRNLGGRLTVLISSHNLQEIENLCHSIAIIDKGRIIAHGDTKSILSQYSVGQGYQLKVKKHVHELSHKLKKVPGILSVGAPGESADSLTLTIRHDALENSLDDILHTVMSGNHGFQELYKKKSSLEETFMAMTE